MRVPDQKRSYVEKAMDWPYSSIRQKIARGNLNEGRGYSDEDAIIE
jgi:hypothetical protein